MQSDSPDQYLYVTRIYGPWAESDNYTTNNLPNISTSGTLVNVVDDVDKAIAVMRACKQKTQTALSNMSELRFLDELDINKSALPNIVDGYASLKDRTKLVMMVLIKRVKIRDAKDEELTEFLLPIAPAPMTDN